MKIAELEKTEEASLEAFKSKEYPLVDREHYGDNPPDFSPREIKLLMKDGDAVRGFITIIIKAGIAYIDSLLVASEHRGNGIGKQLVVAAEQKSRELGAHKIWLETGADWPAKVFYEELGYSIRTVLPNDVGHRECVLMDKML